MILGMRFQRRTVLVGIVLACWIWPGITPRMVSMAQTSPDFRALIDSEDVMPHIRALAVDIGARPVGSAAELRAAEYIAASFEAWGYTVQFQTFETVEATDEGAPVMSRNVIATRAGDVLRDDQIIVIGAHLDSAHIGTGAGDNASGVAVLLAVAEVLTEVDLTYTVVFVAFGAEETGTQTGAERYVQRLGDTTGQIIAMLNIDTIGIGTQLTVYAGATITSNSNNGAYDFTGGPTWVRDLALDLATELELPFSTSSESSWDGFTGAWSDHYAFVLAGIPVAYFEAWQWENVENPWWGQETAAGDVLHTAQDVYAAVVPEKVEMTAELVAATTYALAMDGRPGE